ncbi:unnamed protein product [Pleuronectes platessa]|uniref:Uncharacterized protein n=1 Tax=Pleuronectes platessa TaxID=8262 RepID=A0A9N7YYQ7_PLEPL|nr:unnamed protein product [Pleuronectes platessa]
MDELLLSSFGAFNTTKTLGYSMIEARAADNVTHPAGARYRTRLPRWSDSTLNSLPLAELLQCWGDFPSTPGGRRNDHGHKLSPN